MHPYSRLAATLCQQSCGFNSICTSQPGRFLTLESTLHCSCVNGAAYPNCNGWCRAVRGACHSNGRVQRQHVVLPE